MGALNILNSQLHTESEIQGITVTNATNAVNATNYTVTSGDVQGVIGSVATSSFPTLNQSTTGSAAQLGGQVAANYARTDRAETFNGNMRVVGTINATGNIGAFVP